MALRKILQWLPGGAAIGSSDPDAKLVWLEAFSGNATLAIFLGIVVEIAVLWLPGAYDRAWQTVANILIGGGLIAEYVAIRLTIVASGESKAVADLKVAAANERAAKAELELAKIKLPRQWDTARVAAKIGQFSGTLAAIAVSVDEPEQWHVADLMYDTLQQAGWKVVDSWPGVAKERWQRGPGERPVMVGTKSGLSSGIMITPVFGDEVGKAPEALATALREEGVAVDAFPIHSNVHRHVRISIGSKI